MSTNGELPGGDLAATKAGSAASAALNRVRSLAASAPAGRAFDAIATLSDISRRIETSLSVSDKGPKEGDRDTSCLELARAVVLMDRLTAEASVGGERSEPHYLKRRTHAE
jgi:hypothetical protein